MRSSRKPPPTGIDPRSPRAPGRIRLALVARTAGEGFEVRDALGRWIPFYIQGVNLGVALPGRFPSEFPTDSALYMGWLDTLAAMNANALRVYTILPPSFYRALRAWNVGHPRSPLWLVHGVWTELPPEHDFDDPEWKAAVPLRDAKGGRPRARRRRAAAAAGPRLWAV